MEARGELQRMDRRSFLRRLSRESRAAGSVPKWSCAANKPRLQRAGVLQVMAKFQKGQSGNPNGRAKGSRNGATMLVEQIFDEKLFGVDRKADAIISKVIEQAVNGDTACIRLCFDRFAPARKDRPVYFALPKMQ